MAVHAVSGFDLDQITGHSHEGDHGHDHTREEEEQLAKARESFWPQAEWAIKRLLIVDAVADSEGLRATQDDIDKRVEELAERHGMSPSVVWLQLEKSGQLESLEREITEDRVFQHLLAQSNVA